MPMAKRPASCQEVYALITKVLVDSLGVDDDEINLTSQLGADLGAESIDILDILFRIDMDGDVPIRLDAFVPNCLWGDGQTVNSNYLLSEPEARELDGLMPVATTPVIKEGASLGAIFNVELLCKLTASVCGLQWNSDLLN